MKKLVLIDGSSYFFRAYYAIQHLSNSKGFPTNAVFGFINMLVKVLEVEKPELLGICFDTAKPSFRKEKFSDYKANRSAPPEDLVVQIPVIQKAVDCFKIFRVEKEGFEADDLIGTLTKKALKEGYKVDIISGDKDLMQLVDSKVTLYDSMRDVRYDSKGVFEKFQVHPDQMVDFLALMGDSSDNIPGVAGIGKKTAADLLHEFKSLDGLYKNLGKIKSDKRRETLESEKKNAYLSKELVTLDCDVPFKFSWDELQYTGPDKEALREFCEEYEFQNILKRFQIESKPKTQTEGHYETIETEKRLKEVLKDLAKCPVVAVDTETTSLVIHDADLVGISLCGKPGEAYYIPVGHKKEKPLSVDRIRTLVRPFFEEPETKFCGQNLKYDLQVLRRFGIELKAIVSDTMLASYLLESDQPHNLDSLAFRHLGHQNILFEEVVGKGKNQISFADVSLKDATQYAAEDADVTLQLNNLLVPKLKKGHLKDLFEEIEVPLLEVLADMEFEGVEVDKKKLEKMQESLGTDLEALQKKIFKLAGEEFNINSPKQLSKILFEKLGLPVQRKTKTGVSTDERVLTELSSKHEIAEVLLNFRELTKLKSTYVDGLLEQIHRETGRVHTSFNQTVTATGRLSSSNPNLQNIPAGNHEKYNIRSVFIPRKGNELFAADYSQIELRILADLSGDKELLAAFERDEDVHAYTGKLIFGVKEVSDEQRKIAKTINFGVIYGQTPYGLSRQLKITPSEAKQFIESYFKRYSGVKKYMQQLIDEARKTGEAVTLLGRKRIIPEIKSKNQMRREMAERTAINTPLQGTAADLIKLAMVNIFQKFKAKNLKSLMILQVHDELVVDVHPSEKEVASKIVLKEMESALKLKVPLKVDFGWGRNWSEC